MMTLSTSFFFNYNTLSIIRHQKRLYIILLIVAVIVVFVIVEAVQNSTEGAIIEELNARASFGKSVKNSDDVENALIADGAIFIFGVIYFAILVYLCVSIYNIYMEQYGINKIILPIVLIAVYNILLATYCSETISNEKNLTSVFIFYKAKILSKILKYSIKLIIAIALLPVFIIVYLMEFLGSLL